LGTLSITIATAPAFIASSIKIMPLFLFPFLATEETQDLENLSHRLDEAMIEHRKAAENIAFDYVDAIEAVHGWLNSSDHRSVLLNKDFTHLGTGSYGNYYTQDFIKASKVEIRRQ